MFLDLDPSSCLFVMGSDSLCNQIVSNQIAYCNEVIIPDYRGCNQKRFGLGFVFDRSDRNVKKECFFVVKATYLFRINNITNYNHITYHLYLVYKSCREPSILRRKTLSTTVCCTHTTINRIAKWSTKGNKPHKKLVQSSRM